MKRMNFLTIITLFIATLSLPFHSSVTLGDGAKEEQFLKNTRQLIYQGKRSGEGYFSEDGNALIFQSEREPDNPFFQIYILDLETGDTNRVSPGTGKTTCSFIRPGSNEVLFASTHLDPEATAKQKAEFDIRASGENKRFSWDYDEHYDIFSAHRDGSNPKRMTEALAMTPKGHILRTAARLFFVHCVTHIPSNIFPPGIKNVLKPTLHTSVKSTL